VNQIRLTFEREREPGRSDGSRSPLRALDVLEQLAEHGELRATELARTLSIARPTLYRTLAALERRGYVSRGGAARTFAIGPAAALLADRAARSLLAQVAHAALLRLRDETTETANLALIAGQQLVYADILHSSYSLRPAAEVGHSVPAHATAIGKAVLACLPRGDRVLLTGAEPFERFTDSTLTDFAALDEDLARTRERGYAVDEGESEVGASCVAAAVTAPSGVPAGAISVAGATARMRDRLTELGEIVRRLAAEVSEQYAGRLSTGGAAGPERGAKPAAATNNEEEGVR
jgi:IclR family acetate operon transcriptional repressor